MTEQIDLKDPQAITNEISKQDRNEGWDLTIFIAAMVLAGISSWLETHSVGNPALLNSAMTLSFGTMCAAAGAFLARYGYWNGITKVTK